VNFLEKATCLFSGKCCAVTFGGNCGEKLGWQSEGVNDNYDMGYPGAYKKTKEW